MLTELFFILLYLYLFRPVSRLAAYFTLIQCQWWLFFIGIPQVPQTTALFGTAVLSAICKRDKIQLDVVL
jgi:hypothetical protein